MPRADDDRRHDERVLRELAEPRPRLSDRTALTVLALLGSVLVNLALATQLWVGRHEFLETIKSINSRLSRIEHRIGLDDRLPSVTLAPGQERESP